jgi:hypothetical protein
MKSGKKMLVLASALLLVLLTTLVPGCSAATSTVTTGTVSTITKTVTAAAAGAVQPTETNPIVIDPVNREIRIAAKVNGTVFTQPTWHAVVYTGGSAAGASLFQSFANPDLFFAALTYFGGVPGNNMPAPTADYSTTYVKGSDVSISVTWAGAPKTYNLIDVVKDPDGASGKGIQMKFGGNLAVNQGAGTGCLSCFYSCPIGITSNSVYDGADMARQKTAGQAGFLGNSSILPANGTIVVLTYKVTS